MLYEWDAVRNQANIQKHKVGFEEARTVFDDPDAIEMEATHRGEYRVLRIGKTAAGLSCSLFTPLEEQPFGLFQPGKLIKMKEVYI